MFAGGGGGQGGGRSRQGKNVKDTEQIQDIPGAGEDITEELLELSPLTELLPPRRFDALLRLRISKTKKTIIKSIDQT